jgi:DNA primase
MDDIEKIKQKIDIVDFISGFVPLKRAGRNFKALCPFHKEKTPSFIVSPERQIWHCFGCGKGGDIFGFLMEYEKLEFGEALQELAQKAGVRLTRSFARGEQEKKKERILAANSLAANFYHFLLTEHRAGKNALDYLLNQRKTPLYLAKTFLIGYAPQDNALSKYLLTKKGFSKEELVEAGLAFVSGGKLTDFFRNRLIFPIFDVRGNIIAFSGRALDNLDSPKYINTRETPVFKKGQALFGLYQAKEGIKKEGRSLVVEGEFDVISAFREGIKNAVAIKGTALTLDQVRLLKRFSKKIVFCLDQDEAGIASQKRSIEVIEKEGVDAAVVVLSGGKDPDEVLNKDPSLFKRALKKEKNIYDFLIESTCKKYKTSDAEGKKRILEETLPYITLIENEVLKEHFLKKLARELDVSLESLQRELEKRKEGAKSTEEQRLIKTQKREEMLPIFLFALVLQAKEPLKVFTYVEKILAKVEWQNPVFKRLYERMMKKAGQESFSIQEFSQSLPKELLDIFDKCFLFPLPRFETENAWFKETQKRAEELFVLSIKERVKKLAEEIKEKERHGENIESLQEEFNNLTKELKETKISDN